MSKYDADTRFSVSVSLAYSQAERERIGRQIIKFIIDRTAKGLDVNNNKFTIYSKDYKSSLVFELARKTNLVNLELTGNMLNSIRILDAKISGFVVIGIDNRTQPQAYNHQVGDTLPMRKFLGIKKEDLDKILSDNPPQLLKQFKPTNTKFINKDAKTYIPLQVKLDDVLFNLEQDALDINSTEDRKRIDAIKDVILTKNEIDMPVIKALGDELRITDGRHRLVAFKELGFDTITLATTKDSLALVMQIINKTKITTSVKQFVKELTKPSNTAISTPKQNKLTAEEKALLDKAIKDVLKRQGISK